MQSNSRRSRSRKLNLAALALSVSLGGQGCATVAASSCGVCPLPNAKAAIVLEDAVETDADAEAWYDEILSYCQGLEPDGGWWKW